MSQHLQAPPWLDPLLVVATVVYGAALLASLVRPALGRWLAALAAVAHVVVLGTRGWLIGFLPLTNKHESFAAAALALAIIVVATWQARRLYVVPLLLLVLAALGAALAFPRTLGFPSPLLRTIWYPLHVPLSFVSYAVWAAAATSGLVWCAGREPAWLARLDRQVLWGFGLWSLSMICGGVWGVVAWGAYFLWDPKVIWSVILWFHYAAMLHLPLAPTTQHRPWARPALAFVGFAFVLVAFVGTSFFFGRSSHAF